MICRWGWHRWKQVGVEWTMEFGFVYTQDCRCGRRREVFWT